MPAVIQPQPSPSYRDFIPWELTHPINGEQEPLGALQGRTDGVNRGFEGDSGSSVPHSRHRLVAYSDTQLQWQRAREDPGELQGQRRSGQGWGEWWGWNQCTWRR